MRFVLSKGMDHSQRSSAALVIVHLLAPIVGVMALVGVGAVTLPPTRDPQRQATVLATAPASD